MRAKTKGTSANIFEELLIDKQAQEFLQLKDAAIESTSVPMIFTNPSGIIIYNNNAVRKLLGVGDEDLLIKRPLDEVVNLGKVILDEITESYHGESFVRNCDKKLIPVMINLSKVYDHAGKMIGLMVFLIDNREQKKLEQMQEKLIHSSQLATIGTITAGFAHELVNPLLVISGGIEMINEDPSDCTKTMQIIETINAAAQRMHDIVNELRTFSRKSHAKDIRRININNIINKTMKLTIGQLNARNIKVELSLDNKLPEIDGNPSNLESVFQNLIINSRDALLEVDDEREKTIKISTSQKENRIVIEMSDNGQGMKEETKQKMFEPFFTTKDSEKGTGLGMSIIHNIVNNHLGTISFESTYGEGTTFILSFPIVK